MIRKTNRLHLHKSWAGAGFGVMLLAGCTLVMAGCVTSPASETRDSSFPAAGSLSLTVDSFNGKIEISKSTGNVVAVHAVLRDATRINYSAVQNGNRIIVTAAGINEWLPFFGWHGADIQVSIPSASTIDLKTSNGQILVDGMESNGTLQSSNGGVTLQNVNGKFTADTTNGRIQVSNFNGSGNFKTSNGGVGLENVAGDFIVSTTNGGIAFNGQLADGGQNRLTTSNGGVSVTLNGTPGVNLEAYTSNGKINCLLPILSQQSTSTHLSGTIGAGGADLYVKTSNGNVTVK